MGWLRLDELARMLKINETAKVKAENFCLYYEGEITRLSENLVYVSLEEQGGWGEDLEGEEHIEDLDWLWVLEYHIIE